MSGASATPADFDLREQLVRIDRMLAETHKFQEESNQFAAEIQKVGRERWLAPVIASASVIAAFGGAIAATLAVLRIGH